MTTAELAALLRLWIPEGATRAWARACRTHGLPLSASALARQRTGEVRPTPETFLAIGQVQARPSAEVSMAVALACGDVQGAELWRRVLEAQRSLDGVAGLLDLVSAEAADAWARGRA